MKIFELLQQAQYSRITVGDRWLVWSCNGWKVLERRKHQRHTKIIIETFIEDLAVLELLKGEPEAYSDLIEKAEIY
jgi:hypothetical protein